MKGALFARYSRTHKSLRRLFLDEFVADLDLTGDLTVDATVGLRRAEELYDRVFLEYGDDSVAQLGGVHLACEQSSNLLTKILEWGRLMAYLEQSTRYIPYDEQARWPLPLLPRLRGARRPRARVALHRRHGRAVRRPTSEMLPHAHRLGARALPEGPRRLRTSSTSRRSRRRRATRSRGILPAATLSNVGIYGTGQAFEALLLRMRAHPLPEARSYAAIMLEELRKVIPSFLARVDREDRGVVWSAYLAETRDVHRRARRAGCSQATAPSRGPRSRSPTSTPTAEDKLLGGDLLPADAPARRPGAGAGAHARRRTSASRCCARTSGSDATVVTARAARSSASTTASTSLADYGAFRDLQRHRMLTIEWQRLSIAHGYEIPEPIVEAGLTRAFDDAMARSADAPRRAASIRSRSRPSYAVSLAYRVRFAMQMNAREAMHLLELRTAPSGHPSYRRIAQEMHRLIAEQAGPPRDRRGDELRRPHHLRARAPRRGARRGGAARAPGAV